jgi:hypothetical protein
MRYWEHTASERRTAGSACSGWATPKASTGKYQYAGGDKTKVGLNLEGQAELASWPTPQANDDAAGTENGKMQKMLGNVAKLAAWPSPRTPTGGPETAERKQELGRTESGGGDLASVALLAGPAATSSHSGTSTGEQDSTSYGALRAGHSRWLQGYPVAWCQAAIRAHRKLKRQTKQRSCA